MVVQTPLRAPADVAAFLTDMATVALCVQGLGCCEAEVFPLNQRFGLGSSRRIEVIGRVALQAARRAKETTFPELSGEGGRPRLVVLAAEVGGRWSQETADFLNAKAKAKAGEHPRILQGGVRDAHIRGVPCWRVVWPGRWQCLCWSDGQSLGRGATSLSST